MQRKLFRVYVDEAGDRGWGSRSSEVFVLAAVVVPDDEDSALRGILDGINEAIGGSHRPSCTGPTTSNATMSGSSSPGSWLSLDPLMR